MSVKTDEISENKVQKEIKAEMRKEEYLWMICLVLIILILLNTMYS